MSLESPSLGIIRLGQGVYTVPETCRILRPSMTPRKVQYWLDTSLLGSPLRKGGRGIPTLLTFDQVLKVRTLQHLRDELRFSLQAVRSSLDWVLSELTGDTWHELRFFRTVGGNVGITTSEGQSITFRGAPSVIEGTLVELSVFMENVREQWETRRISIEGLPKLVSDAAVLAGTPVIDGTRVETAFVANLARELSRSEIHGLFPLVPTDAIEQAAEFEGVALRAA